MTSANSRLEVVHSSLDTFLSDAKNEEDVNNLLDLDADAYSLTETGQVAMVRLIKDICKERDFHYINPDSGDVSFILNKVTTAPRSFGGHLVIPSEGRTDVVGHTSRHNSYVNFAFGEDNVYFTAVHMLALHGHARIKKDQLKQAREFASQVDAFAVGRNLSIGSGDFNTVLPDDEAMQAILDHNNLTTTAHETHTETGTHGKRRIDYVVTANRDKRLSVHDMRVLKGRRFNSDHDPLHVTLDIKVRS